MGAQSLDGSATELAQTVTGETMILNYTFKDCTNLTLCNPWVNLCLSTEWSAVFASSDLALHIYISIDQSVQSYLTLEFPSMFSLCLNNLTDIYIFCKLFYNVIYLDLVFFL